MFLHKRQTYSNVQTFKKPISNANHSNSETRNHQNLYLVLSPFIGECFNTQMELDNVHDKYAVKVLKNQAVVSHVPREISRYCSFVLNSGGTMDATVTGARENRSGNGMEVQRKYKLKGPKTFLSKAEYLEILSVEDKQIYENIIASFFP